MVQRHTSLMPSSWTVEGYFGNALLYPADIQRDFQWGERQITQLLNDFFEHFITNPSNRPYFLGTMVGCGEPPAFRLYDGLQRTTTLTILIAILRDRIEDAGLRRRLNQCIYQSDDQPRLNLPPGDRTLEQHILPEGATRSRIPGGGRNYGRKIILRSAFNRIVGAIESLDAGAQERLAYGLLEDTLLVFMIARDDVFARDVFRGTNMRGLQIEDSDLIQGSLPDIADSEGDAAAMVRAWQQVRQTVREGFRDFTLALDLIARTNDHATSRNSGERAPTSEQRIKAFEAWMGDIYAENKDRLFDWMSAAQSYAEDWNDLTPVRVRSGHSQPLIALSPIQVIGWDDWKPLAMELRRQSRETRGLGQTWLAAAYGMLNRRAMGLYLAGIDESNLPMIFARAILSLRDAAERGVDGPELINAFARVLAPSNQQRAKLEARLIKPFTSYETRREIVLWIELMQAGADRDHAFSVSVEHILPQNPILSDEWIQTFPDVAERKALEDLLGNLVLVPYDLNARLASHPFEEKVRLMSEWPGGLEKFALAGEVLSEAAWTPDTIRARTSAVAKQVVSMLELPGEAAFL